MTNSNDIAKNLTQTISTFSKNEIRRISVIRDESGYGFTLSRSKIYANDQKKNSSPTSLDQLTNESEPGLANQTEVVYVKHVRANGPAFIGGLREGDRPISINDESLFDKTYADVISMIENSDIILELIVIPSFIQTSGSSITKKAMSTTQTVVKNNNNNNNNSNNISNNNNISDNNNSNNNNNNNNNSNKNNIFNKNNTSSIAATEVPKVSFNKNPTNATPNSSLSCTNSTSPSDLNNSSINTVGTLSIASIPSTNLSSWPSPPVRNLQFVTESVPINPAAVQVVSPSPISHTYLPPIASTTLSETETEKVTTTTTSLITVASEKTSLPTFDTKIQTMPTTSTSPNSPISQSSTSPHTISSRLSVGNISAPASPRNSSISIDETINTSTSKKPTAQKNTNFYLPTKLELIAQQNSVECSLNVLSNSNVVPSGYDSQTNTNISTSITEQSNLASATTSTATLPEVSSLSAVSIPTTKSTSSPPPPPPKSASPPTTPTITTTSTNTKPTSSINSKYSNLIAQSNSSIGSGISALLYSLLKNSSKAATEPPPEISNSSLKRVNRLKDSSLVQQLTKNGENSAQPSQSIPTQTSVETNTQAKETPKQQNFQYPQLSTPVPPLATNESSSLSSTSSSPHSKTKQNQKLKNLQESLINQYSNHHLNESIDKKVSQDYARARAFVQNISDQSKERRDISLYPEYKFSYQQYYLENKHEQLTNNNNNINNKNQQQIMNNMNHQTTNKVNHPFYYDTLSSTSRHHQQYEPQQSNSSTNYSEDEMSRQRYLNMLYNNYPTPYSATINSNTNSASTAYKNRQQDLAALIRRTAELSQNQHQANQQPYYPISTMLQQHQHQQHMLPGQVYQTNQPEFYPNHHHYQLNRSSFNNSSIKSQSSTNFVIAEPQTDSFVDQNSNNKETDTTTKKNSKSPNKSTSPNKESVLLNAVAAAAAAVNKASPQLFSKYIETVHRAMHGYRNPTTITELPNSSKPDSKPEQQEQTPSFKPSSLPPTHLRDNYTTPYEMYTSSDHDLVTSKRFVDQCRQIFESQQNQQLADKQFYTLPTNPTAKINKPRILDDYSLSTKLPLNNNYPIFSAQVNQITKPVSSSLSPVRGSGSIGSACTKLSDLAGSANQQTNDSNAIRASSLGFANSYNASAASSMLAFSQFPKQYPYQRSNSTSHFNHFNRASYKGECKRLMANGHMETVAERAARFEEIDMNRYMRMKQKLYELELQQQQQQEQNNLDHQYRHQHTTRDALMHRPISAIGNKLDEQNHKGPESFVTKLKSLKPVNKNNQTTSSDSSIIQPESKLSSMPATANQISKLNDQQEPSLPQQQAMWSKFEPFIARYYNVGNSPSSYSNNTSNNVKLAANFISNNNSNTCTNMLTNFVGGMAGCNSNTQQFNAPTTNNTNNFNSNYYQQQQQNQFYINKLYSNETVNKQPPSVTTPYNVSRRELLLNELKHHQQQQQQQQMLLQQQQQHHHHQNTYRYDFDEDEDDEEQERLLYSKRRSITSSPVRYNFNSKSSPPVIMRIDSAKTARLNRLRSSDQHNDFINYNNNNTDQQQINTPSSTIEPWSKNRTTTSSSNKSTPSNFTTTKSLAHYNFLHSNQINDTTSHRSNTFTMTSDVGETTSTDSDIGTSPSGTTLASPPSSPQQQQNKSIQKFPNTLQPSPSTSSIIRHHSYLNAVQLNDFKLNQQMKSNNFATINENEIGSPKQHQTQQQHHHQQQQQQLLQQQQQNNQIVSDEIKYYYSPSATVIRQQKLLQQKQQQHQQLIQIQNRIKAINEEKLLASLSSSIMARTRSKSSTQMHQSISLEQPDYTLDEYENSNKYQMDHYRIVKPPPVSQMISRHILQQRSQTITASTTDENEDNRTNSYLKATNKQQKNDQQIVNETKKLSSTTPLQSRNTSIKKLKNFFGEKTPVVLQAVENKNIIASDEFLTTLLETIKEGVLNCKIVAKDGKRSTDRSWRPAWAVLKKSGALFLCKEKKDNIMVPSVDSYPINLKNSNIDIAFDYNKRKCVFKVITFNNSEYLFQTADNESMMEWIRAMQQNSTAPDLAKTPSQSIFNDDSQMKYNQMISQQQSRHNWMSVENNNSSNSLNEPMTVSTSNLNKNNLKMKNQSNEHMIASSPEEYFLNNSQISNFNNNSNSNMSPLQARKGEDSSPRRDNSNRRWVRQMTRRIRDFMTNTSTNDDQLHSHTDQDHQNESDSNRNFGVPLDKCEPSSTSPYVPVVIEVCTRLIELHIIDEGIYRKVGQKQVVNSLRSQLNRGILNIDVSDYNWDNPHAVVSLLKCFLNELPDSLTTSQFYNEFIQMCRIDHHHIRLIAIKKLLRKLSIYNYETLRYLSAHLRRVAAAYQHNKMTIKNLCIAFSQSLIRLNEANCETIKSDHVSQSLLIELILIYHDWLFDSSQMDNVPDQIKDLVEAQLFQQYCSYIEPICYSDLLLNIMKSIRSRWYSTNSSMTSNTSNTVTAAYNNKNTNLSNSSSNEHDFNSGRQSNSNIQFRSTKKEIFRNAKSASVLNNTQPKSESQKAKVKKQEIPAPSKSNSEKHVRSRSVDIRFKTIGMLLSSSSSSNGNKLSKSKNSDTNRTKSDDKKLIKYKTEGFAKQKQRATLNPENLSSSSNSQTNSIKFKKFQPPSRKSYSDLIKTTLLEDLNFDNDSDNNNKSSKSSDLTSRFTYTHEEKPNSDINEKLDEQFINFKMLEKKSEQEREKLSSLMKKLEIDLMNAKMDLLEEEYVKSAPTILNYPNLSTNLLSNTIKMNQLPSHVVYNSNNQHFLSLASSSSSSSANSSTNPNENKENKQVCMNKHFLSSCYSSSSGIVATTGPSSSSSSCVSTSPPLDTHQKSSDSKQTDSQTVQQLNKETKPSSQTQNFDSKQPKSTRLLLINRPRKLPKRRHTIGSSYDSIVNSKTNDNYSSISSSSSYLSSGDENYVKPAKKGIKSEIIGDNNQENEADDDEEEETAERRNKISKSGNKENTELHDQLFKITSSRSINFLPSLSCFNDQNILYPGPLEAKNITKRRTSSRKKSVYSSNNTTNNSNKKVILNLSSLSMSASSITSSSSTSLSDTEKNDGNHKLTKLKISNADLMSSNNNLCLKNGNKLSLVNQNSMDDNSNPRSSKNFDDNDSIKLDNFLKQNIKFNCTFESLI